MIDKDIVEEICLSVFDCQKSDITLKDDPLFGRSNRLFLVSVKGVLYTVRLPGKKSTLFVNRVAEKKALNEANKHKVTSESIFFDSASGIKVAPYIKGRVLSKLDPFEYIESLVEILSKIHQIPPCLPPYKPLDECRRLAGLIHSFKALNQDYVDIFEAVANDFVKIDHQTVFIHGDFNLANVILTDDLRSQLIDFEYSTTFDPIYDIASLMSHSEGLALKVLKQIDPSPSKQAYDKLYLYRILQCLKWHNIASLKALYNVGLDATIDFEEIAEKMLEEAVYLYNKYKEHLIY